ncbi:MAG: WG repeat-containing protein [Defluviitaleaceae bacterium]|nr:WG repeat-containing protein [Defluviitaleaceae bacterium]
MRKLKYSLGIVVCLLFVGGIIVNADQGGIFSEFYHTFPFYNNRAVVLNNAQQPAVIDTNGRIIIPFGMYDEISDNTFNSNRAVVRRGGLWGVIDTNGRTVIPFGEYDRIMTFNQGIAPAAIGIRWGFIDINGNRILPFIYDGVAPFIGDYLRVHQRNRWSLIPINTLLQQPRTYYTYETDLRDVPRHILENFTVINPINQAINLKGTYDFINPFYNGRSLAVRGNEIGFIDMQGNVIVPFGIYQEASNFNNFRAVVQNMAGEWGVINIDGDIIVPFGIYDEISGFVQNASWARMGDAWGILDINGVWFEML